MKTLFVINPRSGSGRTGKEWAKFQSVVADSLAEPFEAMYTHYPQHATSLVSDALRKGFRRIISVGGDGTLNEVVNGFWEGEEQIQPNAVLGVLPMGTGCDFIKSVGIPPDWRQALQIIQKGVSHPIDVGYATYHALNGEKNSRYFINIMDFGMGGAVVERVNRTTKIFGGRISFLIGIIVTLFQYRNKLISYSLDGQEWREQRLNNFIVANGQYFGGGLNPAPHAILDDGLFDVVLIGDVSRVDAVANLSNLRKGTHLQHPKIDEMRAREIKATSNEAVFIDMDGELVGRLPVEVKIMAGAIRFIFP